jgi:hypothetical protein
VAPRFPRTSLEPELPCTGATCIAPPAEPVYRLSIGHFRCLARASWVAMTHLHHQGDARLIVADQPESNGVVRVNSNQQKRVKLLSAVIGASAVVAVGAVGVVVANERAGPGTVMSGPGMTLGPTTTTTTPPAAPVTSVAVPTDTATPPSGFR